MPRPFLAAPLAILPALALAACAAAPPPAASPEAPPPGFASAAQPREPSPVDREMLAIGKAEEEIDRFFPEAREPGGPNRKGPPPAQPPKPDRDGDKGSGKEDRGAVTLGSAGDPCSVACKALSSMASSADRLCQLAGENDGRCEDARSRVRGASARVKSSCPRCSVSTAPPASPKGPAAPEPPKGPAPGMPGSAPGMPIQ